jgi:stearoyl-CoA desaturase (delta-9 desaturase)
VPQTHVRFFMHWNAMRQNQPLHQPDLETAFFSPTRFCLGRVNWHKLAFLLLMHLGAVAALFQFSWSGVALMVVLYCFTGCIGITLGYHRMMSHRGFTLHPVARFVSHFAGALALQGPPFFWALVHRVHHARSDRPGDPHSPLHGTWWSHVLWLVCRRDPAMVRVLEQRYIPDILKEPVGQFFQRTYLLWNVGLVLALYHLGGFPWLLWGVCLRVVLVWHLTWLINSASHIWGYRNYQTADGSRNLWWVALFTFGEGWHNNHHAQPASAYHGHRWWEIDPTGWVVSAFRLGRLASRVRMPKKPGQRHPDMPTGALA